MANLQVATSESWRDKQTGEMREQTEWHQGNTLAEYPYAGAFFRCLNGSRRISLSDLRFFMPSLTAEELHGNRLQWLYAIDVLIETQGEVCLLPLPGDAAERLFPSVRFRVRERSRHKSALVMQKYSRQQAREAEQKMGIGGGASKAAQTLSDYYIKRAEQYHPVIPIGAGNEVTVVFQDGFQLKTVEEMALERTQSRAEEDNPESPVPVPPSAESHLNGFNTDQMLKQLGNLNPQQFMSGSQGGGNDGK